MTTTRSMTTDEEENDDDDEVRGRRGLGRPPRTSASTRQASCYPYKKRLARYAEHRIPSPRQTFLGAFVQVGKGTTRAEPLADQDRRKGLEHRPAKRPLEFQTTVYLRLGASRQVGRTTVFTEESGTHWIQVNEVTETPSLRTTIGPGQPHWTRRQSYWRLIGGTPLGGGRRRSTSHRAAHAVGPHPEARHASGGVDMGPRATSDQTLAKTKSLSFVRISARQSSPRSRPKMG